MTQCAQLVVLLGSLLILILLMLASAVIQDALHVLLLQQIVLYLHVLKVTITTLRIVAVCRTVQTTSTTTQQALALSVPKVVYCVMEVSLRAVHDVKKPVRMCHILR